jgi:hypothetical protein
VRIAFRYGTRIQELREERGSAPEHLVALAGVAQASTDYWVQNMSFRHNQIPNMYSLKTYGLAGPREVFFQHTVRAGNWLFSKISSTGAAQPVDFSALLFEGFEFSSTTCFSSGSTFSPQQHRGMSEPV